MAGGRRVLLAIVTIALCGLVACSNGRGPDHACDLLTTEDVEDLLGVPANGGYEDTDRSSGTYCEWRSDDSDDGHDASDAGGDGPIPYFVSVEHERSLRAAQSFESGRSDALSKNRVRGLGDAAYFSPEHGLNVRRGDQVFSTYAGGNDDHPLTAAKSRAIERRAADVIIDRLGDPDADADLEQALECGRTHRCSGTRYRACDLLEEGEIEKRTRWAVYKVDGTAVPGGSDDAAVCTFYLEDANPEAGDFREIRRVVIRVEPDPELADAAYREARSFNRGDVTRELPELGDDAFYAPLDQGAYVLVDDIYLFVAYEAFDSGNPARDDPEGAREAEAVTIELTRLASRRVRG